METALGSAVSGWPHWKSLSWDTGELQQSPFEERHPAEYLLTTEARVRLFGGLSTFSHSELNLHIYLTM